MTTSGSQKWRGYLAIAAVASISVFNAAYLANVDSFTQLLGILIVPLIGFLFICQLALDQSWANVRMLVEASDPHLQKLSPSRRNSSLFFYFLVGWCLFPVCAAYGVSQILSFSLEPRLAFLLVATFLFAFQTRLESSHVTKVHRSQLQVIPLISHSFGFRLLSTAQHYLARTPIYTVVLTLVAYVAIHIGIVSREDGLALYAFPLGWLLLCSVTNTLLLETSLASCRAERIHTS